MKKKNFFYFLIVCFLLFVLANCATASGSAVITGETRPPINPEQVKLYLEAPRNYEVIGIVTASSDSGWTEQESTDYAIEEIKKQAAKIGANGILLGDVGQNTRTAIMNFGAGPVAIPVTEKTVKGKALFVK